ncbi:hypothetical protein [Streptomyces parvulus]|uniref:hypothetical protein n=1 Tax=Streptomyces parvulus TaxID=146923 RepID=UPI00367AA29A
MRSEIDAFNKGHRDTTMCMYRVGADRGDARHAHRLQDFDCMTNALHEGDRVRRADQNPKYLVEGYVGNDDVDGGTTQLPACLFP